MNDLSEVKALIARGDKENAIARLASILVENKDHVEAWLLMGELIDDPARKKDCYNQVLRLSPYGLQALMQLQELGEPPPAQQPITDSKDNLPQTVDERSVDETKRRINFVPLQHSYAPVDNSRQGTEVIGFVIGGIAAFLLILYVILNPGSSFNNSNTLYLALIFIGLIATIIILSVVNKNRS